MLASGGGYDLSVYTLLNVYTESGHAPIMLDGLDVNGFGLQNPCGITIDASFPDISRMVGDPESTSEDIAATTFQTCPSATVQFEGYQVVVVDVIDSSGNSVAYPGDYITVDTEYAQLLISEVNDAAKIGTYTVHYVIGLAQESLFELMLRTPETMSLIIGSTTCTSVLVPDPLETEYSY